MEGFALRINTYLASDNGKWQLDPRDRHDFQTNLSDLFNQIRGKYYEMLPKELSWDNSQEETRAWTGEYLKKLFAESNGQTSE